MEIRADWLAEPINAWPGRLDSSVDLSDLELEQRKNVYNISILSSIAVNFNTLLKLEKCRKLSVVIRITG